MHASNANGLKIQIIIIQLMKNKKTQFLYFHKFINEFILYYLFIYLPSQCIRQNNYNLKKYITELLFIDQKNLTEINYPHYFQLYSRIPVEIFKILNNNLMASLIFIITRESRTHT